MNKQEILDTLGEYKRLGFQEQIDYEKFYLYSIITHSTAIEGSTMTEKRTSCFLMKGFQPKVKAL